MGNIFLKISMVELFFWAFLIFLIATILYLLYWYAFRFEPFNFKLSKININIRNNNVNNFQNHNLDSKSYREDNNNRESIINADSVNNDFNSIISSLSILHLSDFHLRKDKKGNALFNFIKSLSLLNPDILVLTGDLVEKNDNIPYLKDMLKKLRARIGKFAVLGVHDYYNKAVIEFIRNMFKRKRSYKKANNVDLLVKELDSIGIKVLLNKMVKITLKDSDISDASNLELINNEDAISINKFLDCIEIVGIDDAVIEKADVKKAFEEKLESKNYQKKEQENKNLKINRRIRFQEKKEKLHVLNQKGKLIICLTHTPDQQVISEASNYGADIILSGHTHGGQVRLPLLGAIITGSNIKRRYASGLFYFKNFVLFISRGLSEGRYSPFRFYCQPEAVLINLNFID